MKLDSEDKVAIIRGIKEGMDVHKPAPETQEMINKVEKTQIRICDKLDNFFSSFNEFKKENEKEHASIKERQDFTNGKVRRGELWRHSTIAMGGVITAVVIPLVIYIAWDTKNDIEKYKMENVETAETVHDLIVKIESIDKSD